VVGNTIAHRFDQDWFSAILECHATGFFGDFANGKDVVAVNADGVDAVAYATAGDAVATVLFDCGGGDCEAVVAADEDYGTGTCGCYVEGGVKVAFAGGAFAEVAGYYSWRSLGVLHVLKL